MSISFEPIPECADTQPFAECRGVDLSQDLAPETVETLRQAFYRHGLLLFRGQTGLTPEREVAFNRAFGWHDDSQHEFLFGFGAPTTEHKVSSGGAQMPAIPEVSVLGNVMLHDYHGITNTQLRSGLGLSYSGWHADGLHDMFSGLPEMTTMFNPPGYESAGGGETLFTSGVRALERIDKGLRAELERCVVAYIRCPNDEAPDETRRVTPGPAYMTDEGTRRIGWAVDPRDPAAGLHEFEVLPEHAEGGGRHPCIRVHPVTGDAALYITPSRAAYLLDAETGEIRHGIAETQELLSAALLPSVLPGVRYAHKWHQGDFVAWLNTLVLHSATDPTDTVGDRLMHRVRLSTPKTKRQAETRVVA
jgi:taurine dioxygenase